MTLGGWELKGSGEVEGGLAYLLITSCHADEWKFNANSSLVCSFNK